MRKLIDVPDEGLESLMGQNVTFFCWNYIYTGELVGVNGSFVRLKNPKIVYETGAWHEPDWKDAQALPVDHFNIQLNAVESWGLTK